MSPRCSFAVRAPRAARTVRSVRSVLAAAACAAVAPLAFAGGTVDGTLGAGEYAFTLGVQDTPTGFGDNLSELNAIFADVLSDGSVRLMLTGNLENNGNGLVIFFDARQGGVIESTLPGGFGVFGSVGGAKTDDWGTDIDPDVTVNPTPGGGSVVSPGFNPELSFEINASGTDYFINLIDMTIPNEPLLNRDVFLGSNVVGQPAVTQTYLREPTSTPFGDITHAFDNSNTAGVLGFDSGNPPGPLGDPLSATTGFEGELGSLFLNQDPLTEIRILPFITGFNGDFLSNQFLPGLNGLDNLGFPGDPGGTPLFDVRSVAADPNNFYLTIPLPTWTGGSGVWGTDAAWNTQHAPNGINTSAVIAGTGNAIEVLSPITLGGLSFRTASGYTIAGPGATAITLDTHPRFDGSARPARLEATLGTHTIGTPMNWNQDVIASVAGGANLSVAGDVTVAAGKGLTKTGGGVFGMKNLRMNTVDVQEGTLRVLAGAAAAEPARVSKVQTLTIAGTPAAPTAQLDLTNNAIIITDSPVIDDVKALITAGYNGGSWNGNGIMSSEANASQFGVGYGTAEQIGAGSSYLGQSVDPDDAIARFTRYGDANLDGLVNLADFNRLAANFGSTNGVWSQGDFNYDMLVNLADFNRLAANFGQSAGPDGVVDPQDWANLAAAIPEPSSLMLVALGALPLMCRRRAR